MLLNLTEQSKKELRTWHKGSGVIFLSEGTGHSFKTVSIVFRRNEKGSFLSFGNAKGIKLTPEQDEELGIYAVYDE